MGPGGAEVNTTLPLILSIVSIFFCCIPGIVATVLAAQANSAKSAGDFATAQQKAKTALIIAAVSIGIGVVGGVARGIAMIAN